MSAAPFSAGGGADTVLSHDEVLAVLDDAILGTAGSFALLLVEITDFATLQARLGFEFSDSLVRQLQAHFARTMDGRGMVYRFGEGRFCAVVHPVRNAGHAELAAERLLRTADEAINESAVILAPEFTVGIVLHPDQAECAEDLLRLAQLAAASLRGRGRRIQVFEEACRRQLLSPWDLGNTYAQALRAGQLQVFYQPKLRVADRAPVGVEALMRWLQDDRAVATPDQFIPLAEEAGLIEDTTWFLFGNALQEAARWPGLGLSVNITAGLLHHRHFVDMVRTALGNWHFDPARLTLEITEGALIKDFGEASDRLGRLRDLGVRVSIDDFGTGFSSLSYFKRIPADELKIDKTFVMRMLSDVVDQRLVETIIGLAHQFRLAVVAEGVETQPTLDMLARMGCDFAQGYLFAPAMHRDRLLSWLQGQPLPSDHRAPA